MKKHRVVIRPISEGQYYVQVDDKIMMARSVDVHIDRESVPEIDIELVGEPDLEVDGLVQFDFTPKTVKNAVNLLKAALEKNDLIAYLGVDSLNREIDRLGKQK